MNIRSAVIADLDALVSLSGYVLSLHAESMPSLFRARPPAAEVAEAFRKMLEDPNGLWLIAEEEAPCGCLYAQFHDRQENWCRPPLRFCNISHIVVHPTARKKGVARQLIDAIVQEADKRGFPRVELEVWSFNKEARAAFCQLGFQVFQERMELAQPASSSSRC